MSSTKRPWPPQRRPLWRGCGALRPWRCIRPSRAFSRDASRLSPEALAALAKALPVRLDRTRPIAEAISSAGGVRLDAINDRYMLKALPGVFAAGEMLDWEAPTGGYLLTACLAMGHAAAHGIEDWLTRS